MCGHSATFSWFLFEPRQNFLMSTPMNMMQWSASELFGAPWFSKNNDSPGLCWIVEINMNDLDCFDYIRSLTWSDRLISIERRYSWNALSQLKIPYMHLCHMWIFDKSKLPQMWNMIALLPLNVPTWVSMYFCYAHYISCLNVICSFIWYVYRGTQIYLYPPTNCIHWSVSTAKTLVISLVCIFEYICLCFWH